MPELPLAAWAHTQRDADGRGELAPPLVTPSHREDSADISIGVLAEANRQQIGFGQHVGTGRSGGV